MFQINSVTHRRPLIRTALLSLLFLQAACGLDTVKRVVHKAMPSVVQIRILDDKGSTVASGSGYVVNSNGLIATNHHVIENATHAVAVLSDKQSVRVLGVRYDNKERDV